MKSERIVAVLLVASAFSPSLGQAESKDQPIVVAQSANECAQVTPVVRMEGFGYTHVVELKNNCTRPVTCEVWTDVDPQPHYTLSAKPGGTDSVITRRGSPARELKAEKSCKYQ